MLLQLFSFSLWLLVLVLGLSMPYFSSFSIGSKKILIAYGQNETQTTKESQTLKPNAILKTGNYEK